METKEQLEAHQPDSLPHKTGKSKRLSVKQGGEQGLTPELVLWPLLVQDGTPMSVHIR